MSFSRRPLTTVAEKKYGEKSKELPKNEAKTIKEKIIHKNINKNNHEINSKIKLSRIPRLKTNGKNGKKESSSSRSNRSDSFISNASHTRKKDESKKTNRITKKEEKSDLQELDDKMYDLIAAVLKEGKREDFQSNKLKEENRARSSSAIKMTSASFLNINKQQDLIKRLENDFQEIPSNLLNKSKDVSNTLKNIKNCASLSPQALAKSNRKIQPVMKKVRSLTFLRTKTLLEEAKQLLVTKEFIRTEIENVINSDKKRLLENIPKLDQQFALTKKIDIKGLISCACEKSKEPKIGATGDSIKLQNALRSDANEVNLNSISNENEKSEADEKNENFDSGKEIQPHSKELTERGPEKVKQDSPAEAHSEDLFKVVESLTEKLEKKTETITHLNCKLFELHQAFEENSLKYNELQIKLAELCKNLQWNYILWREIRKLKNKIKMLEQSNKCLEEEKLELELSKKKLNEEIISLTKLNHVFSQQFCHSNLEALLEFCPCGVCGVEDVVFSKNQQKNNVFQGIQKKVLEEKQMVINQLLSIIKLMSDQESIAHKQKAEFLAKIEELQKNQKN